MKTFTHGIFGVVALLAISTSPASAVVDQALQVDGTNLVLSWPSLGYEQYLIQYRPTLDTNTPWVDLANAYPANSTNRTTYVVPCCVLEALGGGSSAMASFASGPTESSSKSSVKKAKSAEESVELMAITPTGTSDPIPLALYPPGMDTNGLIIFEASLMKAWEDENLAASPAEVESFEPSANEPMSLTSGGCECPDMGFFRVWHIPDWSFNVTNYTYSGGTFFSVDFKDYLDRVEKIEVLLNSEPSPYAEFTEYVPGGQTNWGAGIYFDRLTNGTYQIQLRTTLGLNEKIGDDAIHQVLSNQTRSIAVFNQVTFPDWNEFIQGDTYTFTAKTANPDTDWSINIYDAWGNYVNTGSGHTTDGQVAWTWDLTDWQSNSRDDFNSDPYFQGQITVASAGNGPNVTKPTPPPVKGFPDKGDRLVSFQDRWYSDAWAYPADLQTKYEDAVLEIYGGPILVGDTSQWQPLKFGTNVYTQAERETSFTELRAWLNDLHIRNFYYYGHGGATALGCDQHTITTNGVITGGRFSYRGSKTTLENWQIAKISKYNRLRFVFLDGCSTAAGDLPNAFNISKQTNDIAFYENHQKHPRPAVFVGWNQTVGGDASWGTAVNRHKFQGFWMGQWANSFPPISIQDALIAANTGAGWITPQKLSGALRLYGYPQMKIREYNRKGDWRWP